MVREKREERVGTHARTHAHVHSLSRCAETGKWTDDVTDALTDDVIICHIIFVEVRGDRQVDSFAI